jgi:hypothetical protein
MRPRVAKIHRRFFQWYCQTFYPLRDNLSQTEWEYLEACFQTAETFCEIPSSSSYEEYSYYTYSHRVNGEQVNSSRFAYGTVVNSQKVLPYSLAVIAERELSIDPYFIEDPNSLFYGLGWDFEAGHFKVYFRILDLEQLPHPSLHKLLENIPAERRCEGLVSFTYLGKAVIEEKIYAYPLPCLESSGELFPGTKGRTFMATSTRGIITQYDVSTTKLWKQRLNPTGQAIIEKYAKQGYTLDTIAIQDPDNFTLYFPGAFYPLLGTWSNLSSRIKGSQTISTP